MAELRKLGRLPVHRKDPKDEGERAEKRLFDSLYKSKKNKLLSESELAEVSELAELAAPAVAAPAEPGAESLMADIRKIGRVPYRVRAPVDEAQCAEDRLANRLSVAKVSSWYY